MFFHMNTSEKEMEFETEILPVITLGSSKIDAPLSKASPKLDYYIKLYHNGTRVSSFKASSNINPEIKKMISACQDSLLSKLTISAEVVLIRLSRDSVYYDSSITLDWLIEECDVDDVGFNKAYFKLIKDIDDLSKFYDTLNKIRAHREQEAHELMNSKTLDKDEWLNVIYENMISDVENLGVIEL